MYHFKEEQEEYVIDGNRIFATTRVFKRANSSKTMRRNTKTSPVSSLAMLCRGSSSSSTNGISISLLISSLMIVILSLGLATKTTEAFIQTVEANSLQQQQNRQHLNSNAHQSLVSASSASGGAGFNNFDNLISDFLDDAGNRLKKSKLNSMRQIKPTLRFGRRSDPLMSPTLADQLAMIDGEDPYESDQRKLLAAALANAEDN